MNVYETSKAIDVYIDRLQTGLYEAEEYIIGTYFQPGAKVLDIGCGLGRTTTPLAQKGYRILGIDSASAMIDEAKKRNPDLMWQVMDATHLEFSDNQFDVALFSYNGIDCIYPVSDRIKCLHEMVRVVKPEGIIVFSSHNIIARILNRFRKKPFMRALRSNLGELRSQLKNRRFWKGFILHMTQEGPQNLYMSTVRNHIRQVKKVSKNVRLLEVVGWLPGETLAASKYQSETVYYVWQKNAI